MKRIFTLVLTLFLAPLAWAQTPCEAGYAGIYPCENVDLLSYMSLNDIGCDQNTNDIWGWVSPTGKEYALVGCDNGTSFVDVTDPLNPVYIGFLAAHNNPSLWRDVETYNNYCFSVSEANYHGLQVFDLTQLDDVINPPVDFDEDAYYNEFGHCHTININTQTGYLVANGTSTFNGGLHIVDINDPLNPVIAGGFEDDGYTHDCFILTYDGPDADYTGKEIVVACNEDEVTIVDVTNKSDCQAIGSYSYPNVGYVHQGWFTEDHRYFLVDDELDEDYNGVTLRTHIFDMLDLDNVEYLGYYDFGFDCIDHNLYIKGNYAYESDYTGGVRILDLTDVANGNLTEAGYFDLYPSGTLLEFEGTWSNYPFLPSGTILATSMYDGIFLMQFHAPVGVEENQLAMNVLQVSPNPAKDKMSVTSPAALGELTLSDLAGKTVLRIPSTAQHSLVIDVQEIAAGVYLLHSSNAAQPVRLIVE